MKVRATIPLQAYLNAERPEDLSPTTDFEFKKLQVRVELVGDEALALPGPPVSHFRRVRGLNIELDGDQGLKALLAAEKGYELLQVIVKIANRVLLAVRNYGTVAHVQPLNVTADRTEEWLRRLSVATSDDGATWNSVRPMPNLANLEEILTYSILPSLENVGQLNFRDWALVEEAVQDGLQAGPEKEFYTNAYEHSRTGNLRLAVVESVICLEIVMTQWLQLVLPIRGVKNAKEQLGPQFTLAQRVKLLLPLLLPSEDFKHVNLDDVVRTIGYRNKIAHEAGNLPTGVPEPTIRAGIAAVLGLARQLAFERDTLARQPELDTLAESIREMSGLPKPKVYAFPRHRYSVVFDIPYTDELPEDGRLAEIATAVDRMLIEYDPRFRPGSERSLSSVAFTKAGQPETFWLEGQLKKAVKKPLPKGVLEVLRILESRNDTKGQ